MTSIFEPIENEFECLSEGELSNLERSLEYQLPSDYRAFLGEYGRCMFSGEALVKDVAGNELEVFTMFGSKGEKGNILLDLKLHPEFVQDGLIPVADDMFNNRYVLHLSSGKVGYIDFSNGSAKYAEVADSFEVFLRKIEVIPDEE